MKPRTPEYCRRISEAKKGKRRPDMIGNRFGVGKPSWNKGKKVGALSEEHRAKISVRLSQLGGPTWLLGQKNELHPSWKGGKPHCVDCGTRLSGYLVTRCKPCAFSKERNPAWKGGTTSLAMLVRNHPEYTKWRTAVFKRDDFTCRTCGVRGVYIEADHYPKPFAEILKKLKPRDVKTALQCEELWDINNGRSLCRPCHDKTKKKTK